MEDILRSELGTTTLTAYGGTGGGCISQGRGYHTDHGKIYVKINNKSGAKVMFDGEYASLDAIQKTNTVAVPEPKKVVDHPSGGAMLITSYVEMTSLHKHEAELGTQLARMHLHNERSQQLADKAVSSVHKSGAVEPVSEFGFHVPTCCGYIPQQNEWHTDWLSFFSRNRLEAQLNMIQEKTGEREALELWGELQRALPVLFKPCHVVPALLHGDLWSGNVAETKNGPVIFDAASFYGHHEYEFGIMHMFSGHGRAFEDAYKAECPRQPGFKQRVACYQLFHELNHWNHFGGGYRQSSISTMKKIIKNSRS